MTAAIAHHEPFAELPSRRLRQESERFLAPALLASAAIIAALLIACGAIPTSPLQVVAIPGPSGAIDFLPELRPPSNGPTLARDVIVAPDQPAEVRPVDRVDSEPAVVQVPVIEDRGGGSGEPGSPSGVAGESRGGNGLTPPADPQPGDIFYGDELPSVVARVTPEYPQFARDAGVEGTVLVWALVGLDGRVENTQIQRSIPMLDPAALDAVRQWRFTPALANRHAVRVWVAVSVRFRLHN